MRSENRQGGRRGPVLFGVLVLLLPVATIGASRSGTPDGTDAKPPAKVANGTRLEYNRDIRTILAENCFACHGPDSASRKAGLRLDQREVAVKRRAITPGNPEKSKLIERICSA